ncbi:peptidylprolyl isomerase [Marinifilum caeruleilacunae]|uniref:peptidylprolyl isomerase n=1 Tax=Marinifilum caeruleilacunae TaxID=2499076 RepID=A0ABX1WT55_9BACT|nr:peptidylprolyl isomerase [Marinifilum caeruleilacunae]NOU59161.1 peptidylprolyl isomerase [Marinifilum caeruleilacunae]
MKKSSSILIALLLTIIGCSSQNPIVIISTSFGDMELEIFEDKAPITASHFLQNVDKGVFDNACFYRVVRMDNQAQSKIKIEVIQGGLFHDSIVDALPRIKHETTKETGILHTNGVISMARLEPGSASSEFFICIGDQSALDYGGKRNPDGQGFAAFGKVIKGMSVAKKIQAQKDNGQMLIDRIRILSITRK